MRQHAEEFVRTLTRRKIVVYCIQEIRRRGASARLIRGMDSKYKIIWVGNNFGLGGVVILVARKRTDKILDVKSVNYQIMMIKVLTVSQIITYQLYQYTSLYKHMHCNKVLADDVKGKFYKDLISLVSKVSENELLMNGLDLNRHVGKESVYCGVHGAFRYGVRNLEGERMLEMDQLTLCNTFFKKCDNQVIKYKSGLRKTQIDYTMVRNKGRKRVKDHKVTPGEEVTQQQQLLACNIMLCGVKEVANPFVPKRKV